MVPHFNKAALKAMIEEATVDCYNEAGRLRVTPGAKD
jgi:hypothetical protein